MPYSVPIPHGQSFLKTSLSPITFEHNITPELRQWLDDNVREGYSVVVRDNAIEFESMPDAAIFKTFWC